MIAKVTLSIDSKIVKKMKHLAKEQGTTVSAMFEKYARILTQFERHERKVGPLTQTVSGILKVPRGKTDRELLEDALLEKHGLQ